MRDLTTLDWDKIKAAVLNVEQSMQLASSKIELKDQNISVYSAGNNVIRIDIKGINS
jgi:hypothetical protein